MRTHLHKIFENISKCERIYIKFLNKIFYFLCEHWTERNEEN